MTSGRGDADVEKEGKTLVDETKENMLGYQEQMMILDEESHTEFELMKAVETTMGSGDAMDAQINTDTYNQADSGKFRSLPEPENDTSDWIEYPEFYFVINPELD